MERNENERRPKRNFDIEFFTGMDFYFECRLDRENWENLNTVAEV